MEDAWLETLSRRTRHHPVVLRGGTDGRYVPSGHLVHGREGALFAVAFDVESLQASGTPVRVVDGISMPGSSGEVDFAVSATGAIA